MKNIVLFFVLIGLSSISHARPPYRRSEERDDKGG